MLSTTLRTPSGIQAEFAASCRSDQLCTVPEWVTSFPRASTEMWCASDLARLCNAASTSHLTTFADAIARPMQNAFC
jgi:hypothetical protein